MPSQDSSLKALLMRAGMPAANAQEVSDALPLVTEAVTETAAATPSAGSTVFAAVPGLYSHYRCTVAAGNITVYENTSAAGKVLVPTTALAVGTFPIFGAGNGNRLAISAGVHVVLSGAATVYVGASAA